MFGGGDGIAKSAVVVGAITVEEGRDRREKSWIEGMHPGKIHDGVGFMVAIAKVEAGILRREIVGWDRRILNVIGEWIVGNLIVILAQRSDEAQLVRGIDVENQRAEASITVYGVVHHLRNRRLNAEIAAVSVDAGVVGKTLGVAAEVKRVVALVEISGAEDD